jgi:hypothetical protein
MLNRPGSRWPPDSYTHIGHHVLGDLALGQQQREDLLLPELEEGLGSQLGQRQECAVGQEHSFGHQRVDVRVRMDELAPPCSMNTGAVATIHGQVNAIDVDHATVAHEFRHPHDAGIRQIHLPIGVLPQEGQDTGTLFGEIEGEDDIAAWTISTIAGGRPVMAAASARASGQE